MPTDETYSIADLARLTGLNVRTIRYYLAQGLLPASGESGPGAHYGEGHLARLRLTKRLQAQHLPLSEIRSRLEQLSDDEVAGLAEPTEHAAAATNGSALDYIRGILAPAPGAPAAPAAAREAPPAFFALPMQSNPRLEPAMPRMRDVPAPDGIRAFEAAQPQPQSPERSQWERLSLGPNIELHIRRPLSRIEQRRVERLITIARQVLKEDTP